MQEVNSVMSEDGKAMSVPVYDLGAIRLAVVRCFQCDRRVELRGLRIVTWIWIHRCCGRRMFASSPTPFANASLN